MGEKKAAKVGIEIGVDQSSLQKALSDLQQLQSVFDGLSSGGRGSVSQGFSPPPRNSGIPAPSPLPDISPGSMRNPSMGGGGVFSGGGNPPPTTNFPDGGGGGAGSGGQYPSITIQAQVVNINASSVNMIGGGGGAGFGLQPGVGDTGFYMTPGYGGAVTHPQVNMGGSSSVQGGSTPEPAPQPSNTSGGADDLSYRHTQRFYQARGLDTYVGGQIVAQGIPGVTNPMQVAKSAWEMNKQVMRGDLPVPEAPDAPSPGILGQLGGTLSGMIMPYAAAALPAVAMGALIHGANSQYQYGTQLQTQRYQETEGLLAGGSYSSRQLMQNTIDKNRWAHGDRFFEAIFGIPGINLIAGSAVVSKRASEEQFVSANAARAEAGSRAEGLSRSTWGSDAVRSQLKYISGETGLDLRGRVAGINIMSDAVGPYQGLLGTSYGQEQTRAGMNFGGLEMLKNVNAPAATAMTNFDPSQYPEMFKRLLEAKNLTDADWGDLQNQTSKRMKLAAITGDLSGAVGLKPGANPGDEAALTTILTESAKVKAHDNTATGYIAMYGAARGTMQMSGSGYKELQEATAGERVYLDNKIKNADWRLGQLSENDPPEIRAALMAQKAQLVQQRAMLRQNDRQDEMGERYGVASGKQSKANSMTDYWSLSGISASDNKGFAQQVQASEYAIGQLDVEKDKYWGVMSPAEKKQWEAKRAGAQVELMGVQRRQTEAVYGEEGSRIGLLGAQVAGRVSTATWGGGGVDLIFQMKHKEAEVIEKSIAAEEARLAGIKKAGASQTEINNSLAKIQDLKTKQYEFEQQHVQQLFEAGYGAAMTRSGIASTYQGIATSVSGTSAGMGAYATSRAQMVVARDKAKQRVMETASYAPDNQIRLDAESKLASAEQNLLSTDMSVSAGYQGSMGMRQQQLAADVYGSIVGQTMSGWGNVRAGYEMQMKLGGEKIGEMQALKATQAATMRNAGESDDKIKAMEQGWNQQIAGVLTSQVIPAQQALESGWQERLISQVYGRSGNFDMVANQFTRKESSQFYGVVNQAFGGNASQADYFRSKGRLWYQTFSGAIQNPEGMEATALSGATTPGQQVEMTGGFTVRVEIVDKDGHVTSKTQEQLNVNNRQLRVRMIDKEGTQPK